MLRRKTAEKEGFQSGPCLNTKTVFLRDGTPMLKMTDDISECL